MAKKPTYEELEDRIRELEQMVSAYESNQNTLQQSMINYRTIFDSANDTILIHDLKDGSVLDVNLRMLEMFGYIKEDALQQDVASLSEGIPPYSWLEAKNHIKKAAEGEPQVIEWKARKKNGEIFWAEVSLKKAILDGKERIIAIMRDITDRKQIDESLKKEKKKYKTILQTAVDGFWLTDLQGRILEVNGSYCQMSGYSEQELLSMVIPELEGNMGPEEVESKIDEVLQKGHRRFETRHRRKDGRLYDVEVSVKYLGIENGRLVIFLRDITLRKKAENEKKNLQAQLLQSQKMESIGTLAGGIAHDFNNILTSIIGFTELALDDIEKDSMLEGNLQEVYTSGKRAKELVGQILAFARQSEKELKPIQVDLIIREVLKFIRSSIPATIEIKENILSDSLVLGNQTQIYQIMMNLCTNAAHAMEDMAGVLEVSLKDVVIDKGLGKKLNLKSDNYIELSVADTGTGISPDIIDSIFDPYYTTKQAGEGTGMGLAMIHGIVESYGGKITVDSTLGKGTKFAVYLPITRKRILKSRYKPEQLPTGIERILFVDDEAQIAKMGTLSLESLGYSVIARTSSVEALELFRANPNDFDLVVSDVTMPKMTGDILAAELLSIRSDIPVILCTGYSKRISDESAAQVGIKAIAYKPIVKADLAKTIRKVLDEAKSGK